MLVYCTEWAGVGIFTEPTVYSEFVYVCVCVRDYETRFVKTGLLLYMFQSFCKSANLGSMYFSMKAAWSGAIWSISLPPCGLYSITVFCTVKAEKYFDVWKCTLKNTVCVSVHLHACVCVHLCASKCAFMCVRASVWMQLVHMYTTVQMNMY